MLSKGPLLFYIHDALKKDTYQGERQCIVSVCMAEAGRA